EKVIIQNQPRINADHTDLFHEFQSRKSYIAFSVPPCLRSEKICVNPCKSVAKSSQFIRLRIIRVRIIVEPLARLSPVPACHHQALHPRMRSSRYGTSSRFTMNPVVSLARTGTLSSFLANS